MNKCTKSLYLYFNSVRFINVKPIILLTEKRQKKDALRHLTYLSINLKNSESFIFLASQILFSVFTGIL